MAAQQQTPGQRQQQTQERWRRPGHAYLDGVPLLEPPWSVRLGSGPRGRPALEVHNLGLLLDVLVAEPRAGRVLRGARRDGGRGGGRESVLVWGRMPTDGVPPGLVLSRRGRGLCAAEASGIAGLFWVASAGGRYDRVTAARADGGTERLRVRAGWSR
ncbi:hypothetical protein GXW83_07490 [Streptacidiphilus sp. PB12-B1b]|uniref:hypothetical protein n=1 Tax=Streptacidiphilus sp. PB12-B1b TaxID=2705012 RepID=UPI0015FD92B1|nr:hypothetical protein [Streptacidiphilus sp. PB12-B1b]QMU75601.1 hypothetical protein GXW83_07490 [Streptacidiphilus sp. PB12-B1b]